MIDPHQPSNTPQAGAAPERAELAAPEAFDRRAHALEVIRRGGVIVIDDEQIILTLHRSVLARLHHIPAEKIIALRIERTERDLNAVADLVVNALRQHREVHGVCVAGLISDRNINDSFSSLELWPVVEEKLAAFPELRDEWQVVGRVLYSGDPIDAQVRGVLSSGLMDHYLQKPATPEEILQVLSDGVLKRHALG